MFGYSKQAYYKQLHNYEQALFEEQLIVGLIVDKRKIWKRGSGRNLLKSLQEDFSNHRISIGRDKFFDLLRRNGLLVRCKKRKAITTNSYHRYHKYPNLVRDVNPVKANQVWVSDITYVWLTGSESFCYLFLVTDMYSRKVLGYKVCHTLKAQGAVDSLQMALDNTKEGAEQGCIHHSDRGIQYCCDAYARLLQHNGMGISMTEQGDPLENAIAERLNKTLKEEFTNQNELSFTTLAMAKKGIATFIDFYNNKRPHRSIDWLTPDEAYKREGELKRHWKMYIRKRKGESMEA